MPAVIQESPLIVHEPRATSGSCQDSLGGRYSLPVQLLSMAAFTLAFLGWLNESWLYLFENPIWLNRYTEYAIILGFGLWLIYAERNPYTRRRFIVLVAVVTILWWLIPWLLPFFEPYVGYLWSQPVFPALHVPGTATFFLVLALVFLFGRRVICGWGCPCVGIRETVGFPFRGNTIRSKWAWRLRHSKWLFFAYYVGVMAVTQYPPNAWTVSFVGTFYLVLVMTYFGTFFIVPLTGNRFYCRFLCPYGATFGLLNHAGFYKVQMDRDLCIDCRRCEQVCDMGIPVWEQGKHHGRITGIEDCMGCGRCIVSCPTDALEIRDVRNLFRPGLVQNGSHLLKKTPAQPIPREEPEVRPAVIRRGDWQETYRPPDPATVQAQAARCLDCGVPGCRNACPLGNRIPDWLAAAARGEVEVAAELAHATSPFPELCGRLCPQHRLCEGACTLATGEGAVTIGAVERFVTDAALAQGWQPALAPVRHGSRTAAVVGAGPAGLACAERLNRAGVSVTVYDKGKRVGGLLATGVPPFKLDKGLLEQRRILLQEAGIRFRLNVEVDEYLMGILLDEHDAVFLGTGAQRPRRVDLPGRDIPGVYEALAYLAAVNEIPLNPPLKMGGKGRVTDLSGKHVLILGGGDTAMDCVRSSLRQSPASVTVAYRRGDVDMRAAPREVKAAREEGARFLFHHRPLAVLGEGRVSGVRFATPERERVQPCDAVILAFGFTADPPVWLARYGIEADGQGRIRADASGRTSNPRVYAGGDNTLGPDLVVTALAGGRRAAESILNSFHSKGGAVATARGLLAGARGADNRFPAAAAVNGQGCGSCSCR